MSEENVEVVREIWDAYSRGDFDQIRAHSDPAVVMITVEEGPLYGIEAVQKNQERWWEAWADLRDHGGGTHRRRRPRVCDGSLPGPWEGERSSKSKGATLRSTCCATARFSA